MYIRNAVFSLSNFTLGKKPLMGVLKREPISRQTKNPFKNQLQDRNLVIMGKFVKWHAAKAKKIRSAVSVLKCVGARGATFQWEISWGSFLDKMQNSSIE